MINVELVRGSTIPFVAVNGWRIEDGGSRLAGDGEARNAGGDDGVADILIERPVSIFAPLALDKSQDTVHNK